MVTKQVAQARLARDYALGQQRYWSREAEKAQAALAEALARQAQLETRLQQMDRALGNIALPFVAGRQVLLGTTPARLRKSRFDLARFLEEGGA